MVKKSSDTKQELASTGPEKEHRPDATGTLLEKQQSAAEEYRVNKAGQTETPVVVEPVKPPKRKYASVQASCRNHPDVKAWFTKATLHREGVGSSVYELGSYFGTVAALPGIIDRHVKQRINLARNEQRFREMLAAYKQAPIPAEVVEVQRASVNPRTSKVLIPRLTRPTGPSDFQRVVGLCILLRSLAAVTSRDALLAVKSEVVRREIALQHALETWNPEARLERPGATAGDDPRTVVVSDTNGEQILSARLELAKSTLIARQRELLREAYKTLRAEHRWVWDILRDVDLAREAQLAEQLKRDGLSEKQFAIGMIRAKYTTDFAGLPYSRFLSKEEIDRLVDEGLLEATDSNGEKS